MIERKIGLRWVGLREKTFISQWSNKCPYKFSSSSLSSDSWIDICVFQDDDVRYSMNGKSSFSIATYLRPRRLEEIKETN